MPTNANEYYVYVYIDPRNLREFYYGKGRGHRKLSHLKDDSETNKTAVIREIKQEGLEPIIRVIAKDLTEKEAFLVEKTLIWRLGNNLTNKSSGQFADKFRPQNTFHRDLFGFDYSNGVFYVNVGEGDDRNWDDCRKFGFLAAGQNWKKWGSKIYTLNPGDIVTAFLKRKGFVGIGRVRSKAVPVLEFKFNGKPLYSFKLKEPRIHISNVGNGMECDHLVAIDWIKSVSRENGKWKSNAGLFSKQLIVASLENQRKTLDFLEKEFGVSFNDLLIRN